MFPTRLAVFFLIAVALPAFAQEYTRVKVTETDYATFQKIRFAQALVRQRAVFDHAPRAKRDADEQAAVKASGWTPQRYGEVEAVLGELAATASEVGQGSFTEAELKKVLAGYDPSTAATFTAHRAELLHPDDDARAEAQVRKERAEAQAGALPTAAALQGTWVVDIDASVDRMLGGAADATLKAKMRKDLAPSMEGNSYQFGPGDAVIATSSGGPGAKPRVDKGVFRVEGRTLYFRDPGSTVERSLQAGFADGKLLLGMGTTMMVFRKK